jgi:hypothetical protein
LHMYSNLKWPSTVGIPPPGHLDNAAGTATYYRGGKFNDSVR